ncbi:MAG: helix-turn-helix transcriptional regulator [Proteobacteria bacterium]|nr:helix-turn-helix transcriptional regulator [Pseudomonadota bacterium]
MATTPKRVIELLKKEIPANISLNQFCKKTGINPNSVDKYLAGVTEPTQASLQKLADYFNVTVPWLRGERSDTSFEMEVEYLTRSTLLKQFKHNLHLMGLTHARELDEMEKYRQLIIYFLKTPLKDMAEALSILARVKEVVEWGAGGQPNTDGLKSSPSGNTECDTR